MIVLSNNEDPYQKWHPKDHLKPQISKLTIIKPESRKRLLQSAQQIYQMEPIDEKVAKFAQLSEVEHQMLTSRPVQKIKQDLIRKAKVKKSYSKLKEREQISTPKTGYNPLALKDEEEGGPASLELHPDRQAMLDKPEKAPPPQQETSTQRPRQRKPKPVPFKKEVQVAQQRKEEREARQQEIEESNRQRQAKLEERERFRKAMAKARSGGRDGKRKLGRESKVLLEKVRRIVGG